MGSKNKGNRQRKQSAKFAIKVPTTAALKNARGGDSKTKPTSMNIDINIKTKNLTVLSGRPLRRGKLLVPAPSSFEWISIGSKAEIGNHIECSEMAGRRHRKKKNQEWNSNYENLAERGYAATVRLHSSTGKRRCSNRKHFAASSQDHSSAFQFQAASFSADKTPHEVLNDATRTLSTIHLIPSTTPHNILEPCPSNIATIPKDGSDSFSNGDQRQNQTNISSIVTNRFQLLNDEIDSEDNSPGDSKQPSFSFTFHPPSFCVTSESPLPTALLSQLHMQNTADDVDPDL
jgi:hypothetical protein